MSSLAEDIRKAASDEQLCQVVGELYTEVEEQVGQLEVTCRQCGKCCRFGQFGQELLASTVELGYFLAWLRKQPGEVWKALASRAEAGHEVCPFLEDNSCPARGGRVLGCRVFFCEAARKDKEKMERIYEVYHSRLVGLHEKNGVDYKYVPWGKAMLAISKMADADKALGEEKSEQIATEIRN